MKIIILLVCYMSALASEERTRQMKVRTFRPPAPSSTSQEMERTLKNKREVSGTLSFPSVPILDWYINYLLIEYSVYVFLFVVLYFSKAL